MMKRGLKSTPRHPIEITLANFVHLANSRDSMFSSPFFYACIPQFIIKWNNFRAYRRKILNRFERTDEKYRPSRRDVEKGTRISSPRGWYIYIYIFLVVSSRRVSLIWQWKESTVEKGGNMNNYARFGSIFFFLHWLEPIITFVQIQNRWKSYLTLVYDLRFFFVFLSVFCSQLRL